MSGQQEQIPRKKLIKLCRKLQDRVKTVEAKHASVVKKHQIVKADADAAKAKILELQAQIEGMADEIRTQSQLMDAQERAHAKELKQASSSSTGGSSRGDEEAMASLRQEVEDLKLKVLEARASPSEDQEETINSLKKTVGDYKQKVVEAMQGGQQGGGTSEEQRLRAQIASLLDENERLRSGAGEQKRRHIASLTGQLLAARQEANSLRAQTERLKAEAARSLEADAIEANGEMDQAGRVMLAQQQQLAREKEVWMTELQRHKEQAKATADKLQAAETRLEAAGKERQEAGDKLREAEAQVGEYAVKVEALNQQLSEKEHQNAQLMHAHAEAKLAHEREMSAVESKGGERYQRLLAEFSAHREESKKAVRMANAKVESAEKEMRRLQDQIATGKPDERRIFELAELQARREHKIRQVSDQMKSHVQIIAQHQEAINTYRAKIESLTKKLEAERMSKKRTEINLDYLKALMFKFMQLKDDTQAQTALYPVIAKVMCFSEEEMKVVKEIMKDTGLYGYVTSFIWANENGLMKDAPPVIMPNPPPIDETVTAAGEATEEDDAKTATDDAAAPAVPASSPDPAPVNGGTEGEL